MDTYATKRHYYALLIRTAAVTIAVISKATLLPAQLSSYCTNSGFELGNFNNWTGETGNCCPVNTQTVGIVAGRHTIMTGNGTDPNTNNVVPVVCPGSTYSARLGNATAGAQAEKLIYSFTVTPQTALFVYRYAVVLQDPGHSPASQPGFAIKVYNQSQQLVTCGQYNVVASGNIPGFTTISVNGSTIVYKNWSAVGIDLTAQTGQTITIEFATNDCDPGAHFGYAYISAYCSPLTVQAYYCIGNFSAILQAPDGFQSYVWNTGDSTQSLFVNNPVTGTSYTCELTSFTGCKVTLSTILAPTFVTAGISTAAVCLDYVGFMDMTTVSNSSVIKWLWNFGDGTSDTVQHPVHTYPGNGTYIASLIATSAGGCADTAYKNVMINNLPQASFSVPPVCETQAAAFTDNSTAPNSGITSWHWSFGDGDTSIIQSPQHAYDTSGMYAIILTIVSADGCIDSMQAIVEVNKKPVASFTAENKCLFTPVRFIDLSQADDGIATWSWNFGTGDFATEQYPSFEFTTPGEHSINLQVTSTEGCIADTTILLTLLDTLDAQFAYSPAEITTAYPLVNFVNLSLGNIAYCYWNFGDGFSTTVDFNPAHTYETFGNYKVTLYVVNNAGCEDTVIKELTVSPMTAIYIPNAFTPGNDDVNNYFFPSGEVINYYSIIIYNRWGQRIFSGNRNQPWNGRSNGEHIQSGNYVYQIAGKDVFDNKFERVGNIAVLK